MTPAATLIPFPESVPSLAHASAVEPLPAAQFARLAQLAADALQVRLAACVLTQRDQPTIAARAGDWQSERADWLALCCPALYGDEARHIGDTTADPSLAAIACVAGAPGVRACASQPIRGRGGAVIGALCVMDDVRRPWTDRELRVLGEIAALAGRDVVQALRSVLDEATGLPNRRGFERSARQALALAQRNAQPAIIVALELSGAGDCADTQAPAVRERIEREFAALLTMHFRQSDLVARLPGEQWAVLCHGARAADLGQSFQRLGLSFAASPLGRDFPHLSWCIGVAEFSPVAPRPLEVLLREAQAHLQRAASARHQVRRQAQLAS